MTINITVGFRNPADIRERVQRVELGLPLAEDIAHSSEADAILVDQPVTKSRPHPDPKGTAWCDQLSMAHGKD